MSSDLIAGWRCVRAVQVEAAEVTLLSDEEHVRLQQGSPCTKFRLRSLGSSLRTQPCLGKLTKISLKQKSHTPYVLLSHLLSHD